MLTFIIFISLEDLIAVVNFTFFSVYLNSTNTVCATDEAKIHVKIQEKKLKVNLKKTAIVKIIVHF